MNYVTTFTYTIPDWYWNSTTPIKDFPVVVYEEEIEDNEQE